MFYNTDTIGASFSAQLKVNCDILHGLYANAVNWLRSLRSLPAVMVSLAAIINILQLTVTVNSPQSFLLF